MRRSSARMRRTAARFVLVCTLALAVVSPRASPVEAFTLKTITIDGQFADWIGVRGDPDNVVRDSQIPDDPDWPGQPDRDIYLLGATYDSEYLYLSWRRTAGGTKAITFGAYLDYEGDGLLQDTDKVVLWTVSTGGPYASYANGSAWILHYHQARNADGSFVHPAGDPMLDTHRTGLPTGDGETPDGWARWQDGYDVPLKTMDGYLAPGDGIECEARVAWSDLGVSPGHPFALHFASGNGEAWGDPNKASTTYKPIGGGRYLEENRGQVEDNADPILYLGHRGVEVSPDGSSGGAAGTTVLYTHTVTNLGNLDEVFDLSAISSRGWGVTVTDAGGAPISSLSVPANSSASVTVRVTIPPGTPDGTTDVTTLRATSRADSSVTEAATDTTRAGLVTLTPDRTGSMAPGQVIKYSYTLSNNDAAGGVFDLSTSSTLGFPNLVLDGDGNPISSVTLAAGESRTVVVSVSVPATATVGQQDVMRLTARRQSGATVSASASGTTTVRSGLDIEPDRSGYGGAGTYVQYTHTITNSWPTARTIALTGTSSRGWQVRFYASDGVTEVTQVTLGPDGASEDVIVRIAIPSGTGVGVVDRTTVRATTGSYSDAVTDTTTVRRLSLYSDPGYINASDEYALTDTVFARATGLPPGSIVYFVWKNANGAIVRTSSNRTVDTQGMAFDEYTTKLSDPVGNWACELYDNRGVLLERTPFFVNYKAEITALSASDAPAVGDDVSVTSTVENHIGRDITGSKMTYVIWWDSDADRVFDAGDIYIGSTGAPVTWDGSSPVTPTHVTSGIDVPGQSTWSEPVPWTVSNSHFPNQGDYNVTATWTDSHGYVIDEETSQFYSIPVLGWPLFTMLAGLGAFAMWRRRNVFGDLAYRGGVR